MGFVTVGVRYRRAVKPKSDENKDRDAEEYKSLLLLFVLLLLLLPLLLESPVLGDQRSVLVIGIMLVSSPVDKRVAGLPRLRALSLNSEDGFKSGFLHNRSREDGSGRRLDDTEGELHVVNDSRPAVRVRLVLALFLGGALLDWLGGDNNDRFISSCARVSCLWISRHSSE